MTFINHNAARHYAKKKSNAAEFLFLHPVTETEKNIMVVASESLSRGSNTPLARGVIHNVPEGKRYSQPGFGSQFGLNWQFN